MPALTKAEVEESLAALRALLQEIGPTISKALTQLVLQNRRADKAEALRFLALKLATVSIWGCQRIIAGAQATAGHDGCSAATSAR